MSKFVENRFLEFFQDTEELQVDDYISLNIDEKSTKNLNKDKIRMKEEIDVCWIHTTLFDILNVYVTFYFRWTLSGWNIYSTLIRLTLPINDMTSVPMAARFHKSTKITRTLRRRSRRGRPRSLRNKGRCMVRNNLKVNTQLSSLNSI